MEKELVEKRVEGKMEKREGEGEREVTCLKITVCVSSPACGWCTVHVCSRGPADGDVPVQVQADEADTHVQGPQARYLLPLQHSECVHWGGGGDSGTVLSVKRGRVRLCATMVTSSPPSLPFLPGSSGQGSRCRVLGTWMESVGILHERNCPLAGTLAGQSPLTTV